MSKTKQNLKRYTYDQAIIEAIVSKYGVTKQYIRTCLNGKNNSITADKIKSDYKMIQKEVDQTLQKFNAKN
jgi:hypothetical protein